MTDPPVTPGNTSQHLANERTYLAWVRTAISIMTLGIAINKLSLALVQADRIDTSSSYFLDAGTLGIGLVVLGMVLLLGGAIRYQQVASHIDRMTYQPLRAKAWFVTGSILVGGLISLVWLLHHT